MQALIVDLNIAHADSAVLPVVLLSELAGLGKEVSQGTGYQTSVVHISICIATCFSLMATQLSRVQSTIGKDYRYPSGQLLRTDPKLWRCVEQGDAVWHDLTCPGKSS